MKNQEKKCCKVCEKPEGEFYDSSKNPRLSPSGKAWCADCPCHQEQNVCDKEIFCLGCNNKPGECICAETERDAEMSYCQSKLPCSKHPFKEQKCDIILKCGHKKIDDSFLHSPLKNESGELSHAELSKMFMQWFKDEEMEEQWNTGLIAGRMASRVLDLYDRQKPELKDESEWEKELAPEFVDYDSQDEDHQLVVEGINTFWKETKPKIKSLLARNSAQLRKDAYEGFKVGIEHGEANLRASLVGEIKKLSETGDSAKQNWVEINELLKIINQGKI